MISGLDDGWYCEFGVYRGSTFVEVYRAAKYIVEEFAGGTWDAGIGKDQEKGSLVEYYRTVWQNIRFVAFDSFEGIPSATSPVDQFYNVFPEGSYCCSEVDFLHNISSAGVDLTKVVTVPGFFDKTLSHETAQRIGLKRISVLHIDSDLYASAKRALDFSTPYLRDGTIVIFDEWFQFRGNPFLGEQRAFREWCSAHPEWHVSEYQTQGPWTKSFILSQEPNLRI
jgi:hypothetical protein